MLVLSSSLDREVQAHKHFTGATNIYWLNELMRYVRSEGLLNSFRIYPMVARTNYGTGTTVRGLGKLTGNQMTLVNGPTWGASGIAFASASSQYGAIADFLGSETLTVWHRLSGQSDPVSHPPDVLVAQSDVHLNNRSFMVASYGSGNGLAGPSRAGVARSDDGVNNDVYSDKSAVSDWPADRTVVAQWIDGGGRSSWINKTSESITLNFGAPKTTKLNVSVDVTIMAYLNNGVGSNFTSGTAKATAFLTGSVTTAQRETITDLINAL